MTALPRPAAERACIATLEVLGSRLGDREAEIVAAELPERLADALTRHGFDGYFGFAEMAHRVANATGDGLEDAREHAQAVCEVLGEAADEEGRRHLDTLPEELAMLFRPRAHHQRIDPGRLPHHSLDPEADRKISTAHGHHDLATGRDPRLS